MKPRTLASLILLAGLVAACGREPALVAMPSNRAAAPAAVVDGRQFVGNPGAAVVLTYWFDYQCPFCVAFGPTLDQLERTYGDRIVVYYKNYPLRQHPGARAAAIAAEAARRQDKYVEMHRLLIATSPRFGPAELRDRAAELGLDLPRFDDDVRDPDAATAIDGQSVEGDRAGLQGVPTVFINGEEYAGDYELGALAAAIDARLGHGR